MIQIAHQLQVIENGSRKSEIQATSDTFNSVEFRTNAVGRRWTRSSRDLIQSIQLFQLYCQIWRNVGFVQLQSSKRLWSIVNACKIEVDYLQNMSLEGLEDLQGLAWCWKMLDAAGFVLTVVGLHLDVGSGALKRHWNISHFIVLA